MAVNLSLREQQMLKMSVVDCRSLKQIAWDLHISPKTSESHRKRLYQKLGVRNIAELCKWYWNGERV